MEASFWSKTLSFLQHNLPSILLIVGLLWLSLRVLRFSLAKSFGFLSRNKDLEYRKRLETLHAVSRITAKIALTILAGVLVLDQLGVAVGPLLTAAGIVGVAVGFGAQQLVQDVITGFFLLLDDQIRVGDVVEIAGKSGLVEHINLRLTILRDLSGNVHYIRNGQISTVTNMTKDYSYFLLDMGVAYREDTDQVAEVIRETAEELRNDEIFGPLILEPVEILGVDRFEDSAVIVRARLKTVPIEQWKVGRELNRRLKKRFDELGIEIPFPHLTIYPGQSRDGVAPAFAVKNGDQKA